MNDQELNANNPEIQQPAIENDSAVPINNDNVAGNAASSDPVAPGVAPVVPPYMNQYGYAPYPVYQRIPFKRKDEDEIIAHLGSRQALVVIFLCWVFGILFSNIFLRGGFGLSIPLLTSIFYAIAIGYLVKKEYKPSKTSALLLIPIGLLSLGFLLQDNGTIYFINTLMLLVLVPLQLTHMSGTALGSIFSPQSVYHTITSTIGRPLGYLDAPFKAIAKNSRKGNKESKTTMVILGLLIALPIAAVFVALFISADSAFGFFVNRILENIDISFQSVFFHLFFGTIVALFLSTWFITLRARKMPEHKDIRIPFTMNGLLAATVLCVINLVQLAFVGIQFGYLFAGMALPDDMTYAEYARSGFFDLCGVLCISVMIILVCMIFVQKDEKKRLPKSVSLLLTVFIGCNFVVVASAIFRMLTYISAYDLSVKRVMVTWLIVVFALCMFAAILKIWMPKFPLLSVVAMTAIVMTVAINTVNVNAFVANYNVDSYIESRQTNQAREIDVFYLGSLGPSAAKATLNLYENGGPKVKGPAKAALNNQKADLDKKSWKNLCLTDMEAHEILDNSAARRW